MPDRSSAPRICYAPDRLDSLQAYVLLSQSEQRIEVYRRAEAGEWRMSEARAGEKAEIVPRSVSLDVASIYTNPLNG